MHTEFRGKMLGTRTFLTTQVSAYIDKKSVLSQR